MEPARGSDSTLIEPPGLVLQAAAGLERKPFARNDHAAPRFRQGWRESYQGRQKVLQTRQAEADCDI